MTQHKIRKRIVREYIEYYRNVQHLELPYLEAARRLMNADVHRLENWNDYPEYRSAPTYFMSHTWFTPRCRYGCLSEERAKHLGVCPWTERDSALHTCFRCARSVCMACGTPTAGWDMICFPDCPHLAVD